MMASNAELHSFICLLQFMDLSPETALTILTAVAKCHILAVFLKIQSTSKLPEQYLRIGEYDPEIIVRIQMRTRSGLEIKNVHKAKCREKLRPMRGFLTEGVTSYHRYSRGGTIVS